MSKRMSAEMFRRVRLGNIRALLLDRCRGRVLPDDDAGREYLAELLVAMSLGRDPKPGMILAVTDYAPWAWEKCKIEKFIDDILALPTKQRRITAKALGQRLRVTNEERERLGLRTIHPVDMTDEQMAEQKKAKDRARKRRNRRSRQEYLASLADSDKHLKPWLAAGISRATWYRRLRLGPSAMKESIYPDTPSLTGTSEQVDGRGRDRAEGEQSAPITGAPSPSISPNQIETAAARLCAQPQAKRTDRVLRYPVQAEGDSRAV